MRNLLLTGFGLEFFRFQSTHIHIHSVFTNRTVLTSLLDIPFVWVVFRKRFTSMRWEKRFRPPNKRSWLINCLLHRRIKFYHWKKTKFEENLFKYSCELGLLNRDDPKQNSKSVSNVVSYVVLGWVRTILTTSTKEIVNCELHWKVIWIAILSTQLKKLKTDVLLVVVELNFIIERERNPKKINLNTLTNSNDVPKIMRCML